MTFGYRCEPEGIYVAGPCVVCRGVETERTYGQGEGETYRLHVDCHTCGSYEIKTNLFDHLTSLEKPDRDFDLLPYLAAHIRQATDAAETVLVTVDNWRDLAQSHANTPVSQKLRKVLEYLGRHTTIGGIYYIQNHALLAAAADAHDVSELDFILKHLSDAGLLNHQPLPPPPERRLEPDPYGDRNEWTLQLTVGGWDAVAPVSGGIAGTCFVAMSFHPDLDAAYREGIQPALSECGYRAARVDREPHNESITDRIIAGIRTAQFVVADFTLQRQGVYYEAGFAHGLGRPVIRTCRDNDFQNLHFDTRQYFHLKWTAPADLRMMLADHVRATIGSQPRI